MSQREHTISARQLSIGRASGLKAAEGEGYTAVIKSVAGTLLRFMRPEPAGLFSGKLQKSLERLLAFRDTPLDLERFHGEALSS